MITFDEANTLIDYTITKVEGSVWTFVLVICIGLFGLGLTEDLRRRK